MTYTAQQRLDGYAEAVHHAVQRKAVFDHKVKASKAGAVNFKRGQLVQVYDNKLAATLSTERKLAPLWSPPRRVTERLLNSYRLETLEGTPLDGMFHARHLRSFTPREGTALAVEQKELEKKLTAEQSGSCQVVEPEDETQEGMDHDEPEDLGREGSEMGETALGGSEREHHEGNESGDGVGFFYEEDGGEAQEEEDAGISARVAARRRGRLHNWRGADGIGNGVLPPRRHVISRLVIQ